MHIKVNKDELSNAIQIIQNVIPTKSPLPILSNILIETHQNKIRLIATDLDVGISESVSCEITDKGAIVLPARRIGSIIKELPEDEVELIVKKNNTTIIKSGDCVFRLIGINYEEFPTLPRIEEGEKININSSVFKKMLKMTSFAISTDETRYVLNGLLFIIKDKKMTLVATDGRRLALKTEEVDVKKSYNIKIIIPYKTINQVDRMLDDVETLLINIGENQVLFQIGDTTIISRLIEGEFPDYNQVIPKETENKLYVNKNDFLNALRRASILTTTESLGIKLDISKNNALVSKNTAEIGEVKEKISGNYNGKDLTIGFNPGYLIDALKNFPEENLDFELSQPEKPGVIRLGENYLYLVLPMQLG